MRKFLLIIAVLFLALNLVPSLVVAAPASPAAAVRNTVKTTIATAAGALKANPAVKVSGTIGTVSTKSFTMSTNQGAVTVNIAANTVLLRRFGAKATLTEFSPGDQITLVGKYTADKTGIDARLVRDLSIQKRRGTFVGTIVAMTANGFTFAPLARPVQTVTTGTATRFVDRTMKPLTFSSLAVGQKVMVRGMWDSKLNTVTEVTLVKDFTLPIVSPSAKSATPSAKTPIKVATPAATVYR